MIELFLAFLVKHFFADLCMQGYSKQFAKHNYMGFGHQHYMDHALLTFGILIPFPVEYAIVITVLDYIIHWHVDYAKSITRLILDIPLGTKKMLVLHAIDQALHILTYILFICLLI